MAKFDLVKLVAMVDPTTLGKSYEFDKTLQIVARKPGLISAKIPGNRMFFSSLWQQNNGTFTQVCTCPRGAPCEHTIALCRVISRDINLRTYLEMRLSDTEKSTKSTLNNIWEEKEWDDMNPSTIAIDREIIEGTPIPQLIISPQIGQNYRIKIAFRYENIAIDSNQADEMIRQSKYLIHRDLQLENKYLTYLGSLCSDHYALNQTKIMTLVEHIDTTWELYLETDQKRRINTGESNLTVTTRSEIDWLDIAGTVTFGKREYQLAEVIQKAMENGSRLINLKGNVHLLSNTIWEQIQKLSHAYTPQTGKVRIERVKLGLMEELSDLIPESSLNKEWQNTLNVARNFSGIKSVPIPPKLQTVLRPYQKEGLAFLNYLTDFRFGGILADDMGLGKTVQAIALLLHYLSVHKSLKAIILMPTSVLYNWMSELAKFAPSLTVSKYAGKNRDWQIANKAQVILTTYTIFRLDHETIIPEKFDYAILDEAQYAKNFQSKIARTIYQLSSTNRLCLTGTPIENNLTELYAQMRFLNPQLFGSVEDYRKQIAHPIEKHQDKKTSAHLSRLIKPFILRRTKLQVLPDLPQKTETKIVIEMSSEQRTLYNALKIYFQTSIMRLVDTKGIAKSRMQILTAILRLRQVCCDPRLVGLDPTNLPENVAPTLQNRTSNKLQELLRIVNEAVAEGHKVLVFSQFVEMIRLIETEISGNNIKSWVLTGATPGSKRASLISDFQESPNSGVFLLSLKAGGLGINLTGADHVIHYDPWWNPAVENQATDRAHRIGQDKPVSVYKLIMQDSIEEKILILQDRKKELVESILVGGSVGSQLSLEDIQYLFE